MANNGMLPYTSQLSFEQLCSEADPAFYTLRDNPPSYRMANGRLFVWSIDSYVAAISPVVPDVRAITFNKEAFTFGGSQLEFAYAFAGNDPQLPAQPFDTTTEAEAYALGFGDDGDMSLSFAQQQVRYQSAYTGNGPGYNPVSRPYNNALAYDNKPLQFGKDQLIFEQKGDK